MFTFDNTFGPTAQQKNIYDLTAAPIVESVMEGFNGTIFCYGQTGAGKTHTMEGQPDPPEEWGIMPNAFKHIFDDVAANDDASKQFLVRASYLEIYNEDIRDLLSKDPHNKKDLRESVDSGVYVQDLTSFVVKSAADLHNILRVGKKNRTTGATAMNQTSSRSHSIFTITVETSEVGADGEGHIRVGKLNMVDLAGSERLSKTGATGQRAKEGAKINLSLSALGNVISALVSGKSKHIPYRDSKLTRLLQDSLGGNTKTVMVANCGPADYNYDETLGTLRYADSAKKIKNKPRVNEDPKDAMLREFQDEITRLKAMLAEKEASATGTTTVVVDGREVQVPATQVVEKIVERQVGLSEEEVARIKADAAAEAEEVRRKAEQEREALLNEKTRTAEERAALEKKLRLRDEEQAAAAAAADSLRTQLSAMQEKLLVGGRMLDEAAKQEAELRRAQIELQEREREEKRLKAELDEANLAMDEQYTTMAEEVKAKTGKLKKVWAKYQGLKQDHADLQAETARDREEMLDAIRELTKAVKLRQTILDHFVPPDEVAKLEARAVWNEEEEDWHIGMLHLAGNHVRMRQFVAAQDAAQPETEYTRHGRAAAPDDPRFAAENPANLSLSEPARTTEDWAGVEHHDRVALIGEEEEDEAAGGKARSSHRRSKRRA